MDATDRTVTLVNAACLIIEEVGARMNEIDLAVDVDEVADTVGVRLGDLEAQCAELRRRIDERFDGEGR